MDRNARNTMRAEHILQLHPERDETIDFDEELPAPSLPVRRVSTASSYIRENALTTAWRRNVQIAVPHHLCRDHLANERTALGYVRTAQAFAMLGVITSQMMRVLHSVHPDPVLGFFVISIPLSAVCHVMAVIISIVGCYRFLHWQAEMARGHAISGGWELVTTFSLSILVLLAMLALVIGITIKDVNR